MGELHKSWGPMGSCRTMSGAASLAIASLLLLPAHTYAAPSLHPFTSQGGGDLEDFQKTEDWELGPGTRPGPVLSSAKKVYLRAFLKEMRKISEMITSPNWRLKVAGEQPHVVVRGPQRERGRHWRKRRRRPGSTVRPTRWR